MKTKKLNMKAICSIFAGVIFMCISACIVLAEEKLEASIDIPDSYVCKETKIPVTILERDGLVVKSVRYKAGGGEYRDITSKKYFTVDDNCSVKVQIVYSDDTTEEGSLELEGEIRNFDGVKPEVSASVKGEALVVTGSDDLSGVALIGINGIEYTELNQDSLSVNIKELEGSEESITIFAKDKAGNTSSIYKIKNPYYVGQPESGRTDQSIHNPATTDATLRTEATATVIDYEKGDGGGKEFYTIRTDSDKKFYLIVDKNDMMENVHLLTEVGENDLLNFVNYDGNTVENGQLPIYTIKQEEKPEETTETAKDEKSSSNILIYVVGGGLFAAFYVLRKKKGTGEGRRQDEDDSFQEKL